MQHVRRVGRNLIVLLLAAGLMCACGPERGTADPESDPVSPTEPAEVVARASEAEGEPARTELDSKPFTEATLVRIKRGMAPESVAAIAGNSGYSVGGDGAAIEVLRYEDGYGNYFTVRYDDGVVRTRSGLHQPQPATPASRQTHTASRPPTVPGDRPVAEIAPGVFVPLERAVASSSGQPRGVANAPVPLPDEGKAAEDDVRWTPPSGRIGGAVEPSVVVAGGRDGNGRNPDERSYRPRAKLPDFTRSLRSGAFELRFVNPGESTIRVGIRRENLGLDTTVPPGDRMSLKVDQGTYDLYFIRESEPYTRYEAGPVTVDGLTTTDLEIRLDPEDVGVSLIDFGKP